MVAAGLHGMGGVRKKRARLCLFWRRFELRHHLGKVKGGKLPWTAAIGTSKGRVHRACQLQPPLPLLLPPPPHPLHPQRRNGLVEVLGV